MGRPRPLRSADPASDAGDARLNLVVLRGHLSSAPVPRELPSGSVLWSFEVTVASPDGAASAPVSWLDPARSPSFEAGDAVLVVGRVRRRFFRTASGTQSRTEVVADSVIGAGQRAAGRKLLGRAAAALSQVMEAV